MSVPTIELFSPRCQCPHCKSHQTIVTYTDKPRQKRGHRCSDCGRSFASEMLDVEENEPTAEVIREAIERVKTPTIDRKGYWTRIGSFVRISTARKRGSIVAVYRCELCRKSEVLTRQEFSGRKLCECQAFDPQNPCDQFSRKMGKSVSAAAKANGVAVNVALIRVRKGWDFDRAVSEPVRSRRKKGES